MHSFLRRKIILLILVSISTLSVLAWMNWNKPAESDTQNIILEPLVIADYEIDLYRSLKPEKGLLIYLDDGDQSNGNIAKQFAGLSYFVARINKNGLMPASQSQCLNIAIALKKIAQQLQTTYGIDDKELPILVGKDAAAARVYTALAQADKGTFHAGISINFAPQTTSATPFCMVNNFNARAEGPRYTLLPSAHLPVSWYIFQNAETASNSDSQQFINEVNNAKLTASPHAAANSLEQTVQILQWLDPRLADQISSDMGDSDLPLIEVTAPDNPAMPMALLLTGDGGWAAIDKSIAKILADKQIPTISLDSLSYFWKARTPAETAADMDKVISLYAEKWNKQRVILIGYSFGADVLPFVANNLSDTNKDRVALVALLGMGKTAAFEFRLSSWMNADKNPNRLPVLPELATMKWANSICVYGVEDKDSVCKQTSDYGTKPIAMSGDHHFDEKYEELVEHILKGL